MGVQELYLQRVETTPCLHTREGELMKTGIPNDII